MAATESRPAAQAGSTVRDISGIDMHDPRVMACIDRYWRKNVTIMLMLLAVWAIAGLGCGVLFADVLNQFKLGGFPLGFWFAQQGSIIIFVLLILTYCIVLNRLDTQHHDELLRLRDEHVANGSNDSQEG